MYVCVILRECRPLESGNRLRLSSSKLSSVATPLPLGNTRRPGDDGEAANQGVLLYIPLLYSPTPRDPPIRELYSRLPLPALPP